MTQTLFWSVLFRNIEQDTEQKTIVSTMEEALLLACEMLRRPREEVRRIEGDNGKKIELPEIKAWFAANFKGH